MALAGGDIVDVHYDAAHAIGQRVLVNVPGPVSIGAYATADGYRHVVVGTQSGDIKEVFYNRENAGVPVDRYKLGVVAPWKEDVSPDSANGVTSPRDGTSGRVIAIDGGPTTAYAIPYASGVWRSVNGAPWEQLAAGPRYAYSLAVDPANERHVVVGERGGDTKDPLLGRTGAWESFDAGQTWTLVLDPYVAPECRSATKKKKNVGAVAFGADGSVFAGTACGLFRKKPGGAFSRVLVPTGEPQYDTMGVTAIVPADDGQTKRIWARTVNTLYVASATNDYATWQAFPFKTQIGPYQLAIGDPGTSRDQACLAVDPWRAMFTTDVANAKALRVDKKDVIVSFSLSTRSWTAEVVDAGIGTGLGGRKLFKSFVINPTGAAPHTELILSTGQDMFQVVDNRGASLDLTRIATTEGSTMAGENGPHSDIWDVYVPRSGAGPMLLGGDGGVYERRGSSWVERNAALHALDPNSITSLLQGHTRRPRLIFTNPDDDAWVEDGSQISSPALSFTNHGAQGDTSWSDGDRQSPLAAWIARNAVSSIYTDFGKPVPGATPSRATFTTYCELLPDDKGQIVCQDDGVYTAETFHVIQSLPSESASPLLDAVMMVHNPSKWLAPLPSNPNGGPILLRRTDLLAHPDLYNQGSTHWAVEATDLPAGTKRFWVSGGHANPVYFVYAENPNPAAYRRVNGGPWQQLDFGDGNALLAKPIDAQFGPLWVHPYDPGYVFALTNNGVMVSTAPVQLPPHFVLDTAITQLVTGSGAYPYAARTSPNGYGVVAGTISPWILASVSQIAFDMEDPRAVVVSSPFTGAFFAGDEHRRWQSLTPYLPKPLSAVSDATIDYDGVTVALAGRSLVRIHEPRKALAATYYQVTSTADYMASLWAASGPIANAPVAVLVTSPDGTVISSGTETTDSGGRLVFPDGSLGAGVDVVVFLSYAGDASRAPAETAFEMTTPNPTPEQLTVAVVGAGTVTGSGVSCNGPTTCNANYAPGAMVTLTANAPAGWVFSSWSGACSGSGPTCSVTMDQAQENVTATFSQTGPNKHTLTLTLTDNPLCDGGQGSVTSMPPNVSCQMGHIPTVCTATFDQGSTVTLSATPGDITVFESFSGGCSSTSASCSFVMNADTAVTATFCGKIP